MVDKLDKPVTANRFPLKIMRYGSLSFETNCTIIIKKILRLPRPYVFLLDSGLAVTVSPLLKKI